MTYPFRRRVVVALGLITLWSSMLAPLAHADARAAPKSDYASDVRRINAQLPSFDSSYYGQWDGSTAFDQAKAELLKVLPPGPVTTTIQLIDSAGTCARQKGVVAFRIYSPQAYDGIGVMLVASRRQLTNPEVIFSCAVQSVTGGGPGAPSPCLKKYSYRNVTYGVDDTYYVLVAASHQQICNDLEAVSQRISYGVSEQPS